GGSLGLETHDEAGPQQRPDMAGLEEIGGVLHAEDRQGRLGKVEADGDLFSGRGGAEDGGEGERAGCAAQDCLHRELPSPPAGMVYEDQRKWLLAGGGRRRERQNGVPSL